MKAKVASRAKGHAFEERFTSLSDVQLFLLYRQALSEENEERKDTIDLVNDLNSMWSKNFATITNNLQMFINPDMYSRMQELKELDGLREMIKPEDFEEEWERMMEFLPQEVEVIEPEDESATLQEVDDGMDEVIAGWVTKSNQYRKDGE